MCIRPKLTLHKLLNRLIFKSMPGWTLIIGFLFIQTGGAKIFAGEPNFVNLESSLYQCWKYKVSGDYKIASDNAGTLFLFDSQNILNGINSDNGLKDWEIQIGGQIIGQPKVYKENIIQLIRINKEISNKKNEQGAVTDYYIIRSTNKMTGITGWQITIPPTDLQGEIFSHLFEDNFIVISTGGNLISVSISDGSIKQKKNINLNFTIQPFFGVSKFYVVSQNNKVSGISLADFSLQNFEVKKDLSPTTLLVSGNLLVWGDRRGFVNASSLTNIGKDIKWRSRKGGEILSLTKTIDGILAASADNYIYLLSEKSGDTIWKKRLASRAAFEPTVSENYVIVSTLGEPETLIFDLKTGKIINRIMLSEGNLFTAAPELLEKTIVFQTSEGLIAYSNMPCSGIK